MTIPEIAAQLRMVLGVCAKAYANTAERIYFAAAQNDCSDEDYFLLVDSIEPRGTSSADVYRQAVGETGDQYQRVDGAFRVDYHATGKLTWHHFCRQFKTG